MGQGISPNIPSSAYFLIGDYLYEETLGKYCYFKAKLTIRGNETALYSETWQADVETTGSKSYSCMWNFDETRRILTITSNFENSGQGFGRETSGSRCTTFRFLILMDQSHKSGNLNIALLAGGNDRDFQQYSAPGGLPKQAILVSAKKL